jgi:hypothetical protein
VPEHPTLNQILSKYDDLIQQILGAVRDQTQRLNAVERQLAELQHEEAA